MSVNEAAAPLAHFASLERHVVSWQAKQAADRINNEAKITCQRGRWWIAKWRCTGWRRCPPNGRSADVWATAVLTGNEPIGCRFGRRSIGSAFGGSNRSNPPASRPVIGRPMNGTASVPATSAGSLRGTTLEIFFEWKRHTVKPNIDKFYVIKIRNKQILRGVYGF